MKYFQKQKSVKITGTLTLRAILDTLAISGGGETYISETWQLGNVVHLLFPMKICHTPAHPPPMKICQDVNQDVHYPLPLTFSIKSWQDVR